MDVRPNCGSLVKNHDENKTYILVKLSESFSNAIQEYSAAHHRIEAPTIKFHDTSGKIRFPDGKNYDFSLEQSDNAVECIKQTKNRWESVGKMACCLHVKGKDDVYQRTRTKMEAAEQEKRKYCTKLLGSPENNTNNKSTKISDRKSSLLLSSSSSSSSSVDRVRDINSNSNNNNNNNNNYYKYPDINDAKQLKKYKADFDKDFEEYKNLHGYLHKIEERFKRLRELLKRSVEGSPEWESAKEQIFNEYERVKGDSNFHLARKKYKHIHSKLAHIKEKIFQYKQFNNNKKRKII